jgi:hypothetical protein
LILALVNPATIKIGLQAAGHLKKHWPKYVAIGLAVIAIPYVIIISVISALFSWMGWQSEEPTKLEPYQTYGAAHNLRYEELLAVDLGLHYSETENLDIDTVKKAFVYEVKVKVPVYVNKEVKTCINNVCTTTTKSVLDHYDTVEEERTRTFYEAMDYLSLNEEQREIAENSLAEMVSSVVGGGTTIGAETMAYESLVRKYAELNGIEDLVDYIMAMIQQESGGRLLDVMQSSESAGYPPNTYTNPEDSIRQGVGTLAKRYREANKDIKIAMQAYNFGPGFVSYAFDHGGYSKENAYAYSEKMKKQLGTSGYGDPEYVDHVLRYVTTGLGNGDQIFDFDTVYAKMRTYLGVPYLLGGRNPDKGPVDCSGLIEYVFAQFGINISGTAQSQYQKTVPIQPEQAKPGDLVFFYTGGREISHVGMYVGNDQFINANSKGVSISSISSWSKYVDRSDPNNPIYYVFKGYRRITSKG